MVVKSKRGRRRYIALRVREGGNISDEAFLGALNSSLYRRGIRYKVIQFDGLEGIVRVSGADHDRALAALHEGAGETLTTLRVSGTLKTLRDEVLSKKRPEARG